MVPTKEIFSSTDRHWEIIPITVNVVQTFQWRKENGFHTLWKYQSNSRTSDMFFHYGTFSQVPLNFNTID